MNVAVTGRATGGGTLEISASSGSLTLNQWSITSGSSVSMTFNNVKLTGDVVSGSKVTPASGTMAGMATADVTALP